jgi:hypothetical protein
MKKLFTLFLMLITLSGMSQVWQSIGTTFGASVSHQDLFIDQASGDIYVAYVESVGQRANVRKWNGSTWFLVGNPNFGQGTGMVDIKLAVHNGQPYVAVKFLSGGLYYIRTYYLNGSTWSTMGSVNYQTPLSSDYSLKVSSSGNVFLSFYNLTPAVGSTDLITLMLSVASQGQIGGDVTDSYGSHHDFILDPNEDPWVTHEYGDMSNYVNLTYVNSPIYDVVDVILNDFSGKIVTNLIGSTDMRFAAIDDDATPSLVNTRYDLGTGLFAVPSPIYTGILDDYDMASSSTLDYFFYNVGGTHFVESANISGVQTAMGTAFMTGSGTITDPKIETWNGRVVVSCVRGSVVRVMEFDNPCSVVVGPSFAGCEQTLTTAPSVTLTVSDNNYVHNNLSVTAASTNITVVPNTNVAVVGTYPNYALQFTSLDIATDQNVEFEFETIENGVYTNYELFFADVIANPTATITYTNNEVCENAGLVNLIPHGSPAGGFWTGPGVTTINSKFNPDVANPGTHTINYTYFNSYGCYDTESASVIVLPVPSVSIATTAATCGSEDGTANATITGGTPAYTIYWSNGSSTEDLTGLSAGMYFINVTDSEGCGVTKPATVSSNGLTLSGTVTDILCAGSNTGAIDLTATSTAGIASFAWSNGATTEDISAVASGTYEVTVTANDGCVSTASFTITSPAPMTFTGTTTSATCGGSSDGSATCNVSGGTGPYDYQWYYTASGTPNGTNSPTLSAAFSGAYHVIVTDANGCFGIYNTVISDAGAPTVSVIEITPAGCTDDGAINISVNGTASISSIMWSNGQSTEDISGLAPGYYSVDVFDVNGCLGMGGVEVPAASPDLNPICLVTVDTSTNTNLLVWEKPISTDIDYFNIYRETSVAGEFQFVASVPYTDESIYNDLVASPSVRSWRYKLSAVNFCGEESDLSEFHKTIHLTISFGLGNTINLNWDEYEGFAFSTFNLYRHTTAGGWNLIQSLPSTQFSYTDSPSSINGLDYIISITPPSTCTSTKAQDHNSTRSNKTASITGELVGLNEVDETGLTSVYPNPSTGEFNLSVLTENANGFDLIVTDAQGRVVMQFSSLDSNALIDLSDFSDGIYNLQILVDEQIINRKLVKQ